MSQTGWQKAKAARVPRSTTPKAPCGRCGKSSGTLLVEFTDPRNYAVTREILCQRCRDKAGVKARTFGHAPEAGVIRAGSWS